MCQGRILAERMFEVEGLNKDASGKEVQGKD